MSPCPGWARSAHTNARPSSWPESRPARRASCPPPSGTSVDVGSSPSRSRPPGTSPGRPARRGGRHRPRHQAPRGPGGQHGEIRYEPNPQHLDAKLKVLRFHSRRVSRRQGPDRRTGRKPSKRWEKANRERNKLHHKVADLRTDALHKLTTRVRAEYGTVVIEDLNVAGMLRTDGSRAEWPMPDSARSGANSPTRADERLPHPRGRPLVPLVEDLLELRRGESQAAAARPSVHLRRLRPGPGPGRERGPQPGRPRGGRATGTGVAGDQDTPRVSKPRGADRKTRLAGSRR